MNSFARLVPFLWPSRSKLFLSVFFAVLVALLWGANLSIVFPVVKVLLQGQSIHDYVDEQIGVAQKEIDGYQLEIAQHQAQLDARDAVGMSENNKDSLRLLQKKARAEGKMTAASKRLAGLRWAMMYIVPCIPSDQFDTFAAILGLLLVTTLIKLGCVFCEEVLVGEVVQLTVMRLRKQCFRQVLAFDYQTLMARGTSELMSRFTFDMETLGNGLGLLGGKVIREPLKALACVGFAFWINWRLTLMSVLFVPLAGIVFHRIGRLLKKASHRSAESMSRIYKVLEESFDAIKVVIAFNGARRHRLYHHRENKTYFEKSMKIVRIDALTSPVTELLGMVAVLCAVLPGAYLVLRGTDSIWGIKLSATQMDIADLSVLYALLAGVIDPVRKLSSVYSKLKRAGAAADRIFELMDCQPLVNEPETARLLPRRPLSIEFQEIVFTYATTGHSRPPALDGVQLRVEAGEVVAVVGENGSGKSTLVNLLPRYFDPDRGAVLFNGVDIREGSLGDLRRHIGLVTQETLLFDDTIYENIRYGNPEASHADILRAADQANVTQFLDQLPAGLETQVGEKGGHLSGGQRQRISLARAILRDPDILILDEPTSAIDSQSELLIHKSLESFVRGRTTFIITHSMTNSILDLVTRVVVMDRGKLLASGTHDDLLQTCPTYQRLYLIQSQQSAAGEPEATSQPGNSEADQRAA